MSELRFSCTMCGKCCRDHNLPLSVDEAIAWIEDGGEASVLCEAATWPDESQASDAQAAYMRRRSFAAICGAAGIHVRALLIGMVSGACRNLGHDLKCRIYDRRPMVCRIYPAEVNPFLKLRKADKACPPEAWESGATLMQDGDTVDEGMQGLIEKSRQADVEDAPRKRRLCRLLGIGVTALTGEGFVIHRPERHSLLNALREARHGDSGNEPGEAAWRIYSVLPATVLSLTARGLKATGHQEKGETYWYVRTAAMQPVQAATA